MKTIDPIISSFGLDPAGLPPQEAEALRKVNREYDLRAIYDSFARRRDKWVQFRASSGIEEKWKRWEELYSGKASDDSDSEFVQTLKSGPSRRMQPQNRSTVSINIVRPKVDQAVGRYAEILLPTDGKNWGITPTPMPDLAEIVDDPGAAVDQETGLPQAEVAAAIIAKAKKAAELMEREIEDALSECNYNGECRKVLAQGTKLGTGVMKGPFPVVRKSKSWKLLPGGTSMLEIVEKIVPTSKAISCWNVFPDPGCGDDIHRGSGIFEARQINAKELRNLIGVPGFFADKIKEVLATEPQRVKVVAGKPVSRELCTDGMYQLWEYYGEVDQRFMEELTRDEESVLDVSRGMLVIVNDVIIGALESPSPDGCFPYDFWCHREQEDSPWGIGMPEEIEHQQRVVRAAWRQVMDNASAAAGYHIVLKKGNVVPYGASRDGDYTLSSRMVWEANEEIDDIRTAFNVISIDMRVEELLALLDAAMKFADQESNMPQLMGGERGTAPETVGGMQLLQANAQGPLRYRMKRWDDSITKGQIGRHYDYQMEYSEKPEIKGDFEIDARGATYLLERDISMMATLNMAAITNNPRYIPHLNERAELEEILKAMKVSLDIMRPIEEVEQMQANAQPEPDPRIVSAQMNLQAKQMDLADRAQQREFEVARNQAELDLRERTLSYNTAREQSEFEIAMTEAALDRDQALLKMDMDQQLSREQIAAKQRLEAIKIDNENARFNAEAALKAAHGTGI